MKNPWNRLAELLAATALITQTQALLPQELEVPTLRTQPQIQNDGGADLSWSARTLMKLGNLALEESPGGYTPKKVPCPQKLPTIRAASDVSPQEKDWLPVRRFKQAGPMRQLLKRIAIDDFDVDGFMDRVAQKTYRDMPNIGLAFSGGGYRALLNGAGALAAFDSRTPGSTDKGHLGGLLQSSTYVAGLSGGGWLVGSIFVNNFTTVDGLVNQNLETGPQPGLWNFDRSIVEGPRSTFLGGMFSMAEYWTNIVQTVIAKRNSLFEVSVTDFWSRALSFQLINATNGGTGLTWSSIADQPGFPEGEQPMPILVATSREPHAVVVSRNATVFEFTPFELGSWDPTLYAMAPMKYMGSSYEGGKLVNDSCVMGLDNAGFVMGTSSSLFNMVATKIAQGAGPVRVAMFDNLMNNLALRLSNDNNDIASWSPNPFYRWTKDQPTVKGKHLNLVDGGEDDQNIPFQPLIQTKRNVDVIFAVDSSADTMNQGSSQGDPKGNWPNGTSLTASYQRSLTSLGNKTSFPSIPDPETFVNLGLNNAPTFFGCDPGNGTNPPPPIIVYLPNSPYTFWSNMTTVTAQVPDAQSKAMIRNGYNVATMANGTRYKYWDQCVGCAMLSRSLLRTKTKIPRRCQQCFKQFCWNGTIDQNQVEYNPVMWGNEESKPLQSVPEVSQGAASEQLASVRSVMAMTALSVALALFGGQSLFG